MLEKNHVIKAEDKYEGILNEHWYANTLELFKKQYIPRHRNLLDWTFDIHRQTFCIFFTFTV